MATAEIVKLNTTVTQAPAPSKLQQSGAMISLGATSLTTGDYQFCADDTELKNLLTGSGNDTELENMASSFVAQGSAVGFYVLELGTQSDVDSGVSSLKTWIADNPGVFYAFLVPRDWGTTIDEVGSAKVTAGGSGYTSAPTVTFSAPTSGTTAKGTATIQNGAVTSITITDPGSGYTSAPSVTISAPTSGTTAAATASLTSALNDLCKTHANPSSRLYFFITDSTTNSDLYEPNKSAFVFVPSPKATSMEFGAAACFYRWLVNDPGSANKLAPMQYRYLYGITPWVQQGNQSSIQTILGNNANFAMKGSEGGISTACLFKGFLGDGTQASAWYGMDWFQIQAKRALAAEIIARSNSKNPLDYDQKGVNDLEAISQREGNRGVRYGCLSSTTVSATSFSTYTSNNPSDYKAGIYNGLSATAVFQNGFAQITFNLDAVQFTAAA